MFGSLNTSSSALVAQRQRMEVIASNLANANTIYNEQGEYAPFRRRITIFAPGDPATGSKDGVHLQDILLDDAPFRKKYEPGNPNADREGYVDYPNINSTIEQINALEASRAYEANITAAEATKTMIQSSLRLLA